MIDFRQAARAEAASLEGNLRQDTSRQPEVASSQHTLTPSAHAARAQTSGFARVDALMESLSAESIDPDAPAPRCQPSGPGEAHLRPLPTEDRVEAERRACEEDQRLVDEEIKKYERDGQARSTNFDLLRYWEEHEGDYPTIYCVALDVLPVQASSVPCERAFSASKETDTDHRSNLDVDTLEMLQVLKYILREDELWFTDGWLAMEHVGAL